MNESTRYTMLDYSRFAMHVAVVFFVIFFAVWVVWQVKAVPNAKLFLDDNVVCFSQPGAMECHPRTAP